MLKLSSAFSLLPLLLLCSSADLVTAQGSRSRASRWKTLSGDEPLVIARGGFSGIFPDSSLDAYTLAVQTGLSNLLVWCDVQLTKDSAGICFPSVRLENGSHIDSVYESRKKTYMVNGVSTQGWFSLDFTLKDLADVYLKQSIASRIPYFDGTRMQILTVDYMVTQIKPRGLWLSIMHDTFFSQHNLSMRSFIISASRHMIIDYVSSPEVGFLRSIVSRFRTGPTKLVFQFMNYKDVEPSTNQTYSSLLSNLTFIKTFATAILVPKYYILPVGDDLYLRSYTSLVLDAHRAGLEVFTYNFANDAALPYNYSYDPVAEYLSFIDNGNFSVDGVLSDFPITPSATIDCYSHAGKNETVQVDVLVISNEGASGNYPGCTDIAYQQAVSDGVDILDCPVQMTNDGVAFCLGSINLRDRTDVDRSVFSNLATDNADLNIVNGIFSYNLTWTQIQSLRPAIYNPYANYSLFRNPTARNDGNFMRLSDFLALANNATSVSGVLISIENAAYLAEKQGLDVTDAVLEALKRSGYNNQTAKKIMIKSRDSAVLWKFKSSSKYELVYLVGEDVSDILNSTILEIKNFASSVVVSKRSIFPSDSLFVTGQTSIVPKLQAFGLPVYVELFQNEFVSQPWDFFSDAYLEINALVSTGINGTITDYPATAAKYKRNRCLGYKNVPMYMTPPPPGGLISLMIKDDSSPAEAPIPVLTVNDVVEPPLPPAVARPPAQNATAPGPAPGNGQAMLTASTILSGIAILLAACMLH